jgi:hypothetical protein
MVAQQSGKGRVLAMATDMTWPWRLQLDRGAKLHNHFWRQAVLWLASQRIWVKSDRPRYRMVTTHRKDQPDKHVIKDAVVVTAGIEDQAGKSIGDKAKPTLKLFRPPDSQPDEPIDMAGHMKDGLFEIELPRPPTLPGKYQLQFEATVDGKPLKAETSFLVESVDLEMAPPQLANYALLRQMAAATKAAGGEFYTLDQLDKLLARFQPADYLIPDDEEVTRDLSNDYRWPILTVIFVLLMIEWMFRKRRSLV